MTASKILCESSHDSAALMSRVTPGTVSTSNEGGRSLKAVFRMQRQEQYAACNWCEL